MHSSNTAIIFIFTDRTTRVTKDMSTCESTKAQTLVMSVNLVVLTSVHAVNGGRL